MHGDPVQAMLDDLPGWKPGDLIPSNGSARCYGCHFPWWAARSHRSVPTDTTGRSHMFALCEHCWDRSTTEERLAAYRWLVDQWIAMGTDPAAAEREWLVASEHIRGSATPNPEPDGSPLPKENDQ